MICAKTRRKSKKIGTHKNCRSQLVFTIKLRVRLACQTHEVSKVNKGGEVGKGGGCLLNEAIHDFFFPIALLDTMYIVGYNDFNNS